MVGMRRGRDRSKKYRGEVIRQDMAHMQLIEDMTRDRKIWRWKIRIEGQQVVECGLVSSSVLFLLLSYYLSLRFIVSLTLVIILFVVGTVIFSVCFSMDSSLHNLFYILDFLYASLESRVYCKQLLYLLKVEVRLHTHHPP